MVARFARARKWGAVFVACAAVVLMPSEAWAVDCVGPDDPPGCTPVASPSPSPAPSVTPDPTPSASPAPSVTPSDFASPVPTPTDPAILAPATMDDLVPLVASIEQAVTYGGAFVVFLLTASLIGSWGGRRA